MEGKTTHKTFDKNDGLKRLDIGLSLGVDFKYKQLFAGIGAEYGFLPIDKEFPKDIFHPGKPDTCLPSQHRNRISCRLLFQCRETLKNRIPFHLFQRKRMEGETYHKNWLGNFRNDVRHQNHRDDHQVRRDLHDHRIHLYPASFHGQPCYRRYSDDR